VSANDGVVTNGYWAQHNSHSPNRHTVTNVWVANPRHHVARARLFTTKGHTVVDKTIISHHCGLANDDTHAVVNNHTAANTRPRVNLNPSEKTTPGGDNSG
jgi:hypothetical protein